MLIRLITKVKIEKWKTQFAAVNRSTGIVIFVLRNQRPIVSARSIMTKDSIIWIFRDVENIDVNLSVSFLPRLYAKNLLMEVDREPLINENNVTTPPTTLYKP